MQEEEDQKLQNKEKKYRNKEKKYRGQNQNKSLIQQAYSVRQGEKRDGTNAKGKKKEKKNQQS